MRINMEQFVKAMERMKEETVKLAKEFAELKANMPVLKNTKTSTKWINRKAKHDN